MYKTKFAGELLFHWNWTPMSRKLINQT